MIALELCKTARFCFRLLVDAASLSSASWPGATPESRSCLLSSSVPWLGGGLLSKNDRLSDAVLLKRKPELSCFLGTASSFSKASVDPKYLWPTTDELRYRDVYCFVFKTVLPTWQLFNSLVFCLMVEVWFALFLVLYFLSDIPQPFPKFDFPFTPLSIWVVENLFSLLSQTPAHPILTQVNLTVTRNYPYYPRFALSHIYHPIGARFLPYFHRHWYIWSLLVFLAGHIHSLPVP